MLDLTVLVDKCFEIKMPNGEVVSIKKPTQKMALILSNNAAMLEAQKNSDVETMLSKVNEKVAVILNHNKEGKVFTNDELNSLNYDMIQAIVNGYLNWVKELNNNPN
ncbi:hypothetical protein P7A61_04055 [Clostridium perfringens]|nr:hypothetical protein [Clostridium perfringens]